MNIKVQRKTGWVGMGSRFTLIINGEKYDKIKHKEVINLNLSEQEATIQATQFRVQTNELTVKDNDEIRIVTTRWTTISYVIFFLFVLISGLSDNLIFTALPLVLAVVMIFAIFIPGNYYRLEKLNE